jgi:hypothetical protein
MQKRGYEIKIVRLKKLNFSKDGKPSSTIEKHNLVMNVAKQHGVNTLIETGTYLGSMVYATKDYFDKIITIELSEELFINAQQKFENYPNIQIIHGDSGLVIPKLLPELRIPCIFWLDGHYSGGISAKSDIDAPVENELFYIIKQIQNGFKHILLVDDARLFIQENIYTGYPTLVEIKKWVSEYIPTYSVEVVNDVIIISYPV